MGLLRCEECKKERVLHSPEMPFCEECYGDLFTLKYEEAEVIRFDNSKSISLVTTNDSGTNTLIFSENGELFLNGRLLGTDLDIVEGLRSFLKSAGTL